MIHLARYLRRHHIHAVRFDGAHFETPPAAIFRELLTLPTPATGPVDVREVPTDAPPLAELSLRDCDLDHSDLDALAEALEDPPVPAAVGTTKKEHATARKPPQSSMAAALRRLSLAQNDLHEPQTPRRLLRALQALSLSALDLSACALSDQTAALLRDYLSAQRGLQELRLCDNFLSLRSPLFLAQDAATHSSHLWT